MEKITGFVWRLTPPMYFIKRWPTSCKILYRVQHKDMFLVIKWDMLMCHWLISAHVRGRFVTKNHPLSPTARNEYNWCFPWCILIPKINWLGNPTLYLTVNYFICFLWLLSSAPCSVYLRCLIQVQFKSGIMHQARIISLYQRIKSPPPSVPLQLWYVCTSCVCVATEKEEEKLHRPHEATASTDITSCHVTSLWRRTHAIQEKRVWRHFCESPSLLSFCLPLALSCLYTSWQYLLMV